MHGKLLTTCRPAIGPPLYRFKYVILKRCVRYTCFRANPSPNFNLVWLQSLHQHYVTFLLQKDWRDKRDEFKKKVRHIVRQSQEML
ncbi:Ubiquitin-conjugating enzyme E2 7 [Platanthera guangdongensis]|uniref:Ubiquitin-conjugating enzyme E2 7 n=1 Tax=Platanthera guangdongensis TaxID=2320717 RepID=A0ABR2N1I4_9ASPA